MDKPCWERDGTLEICVDYTAVNSETKPDMYTFPLPRINDLLN